VCTDITSKTKENPGEGFLAPNKEGKLKIVKFIVPENLKAGEIYPDHKVIAYGEVAGDSGQVYDVGRYADLEYFCSCKGRLFNRQSECKHIRLFKEREADEIIAEDDPTETPGAEFWKSEWCDCNKEDAPVFFDDGECSCGTVKHHYHCKFCGKITQIG